MLEDVNKVDILTTFKDNINLLCLGISDAVQWDHHIEEHLYLLQEKLNNYVTYIMNGGYKQATNNKEYSEFMIKINLANKPNQDFYSFVEKYSEWIKNNKFPIRIEFEIIKMK